MSRTADYSEIGQGLGKCLFLVAMNLHEAIRITTENGWTTFKGHKIDSVRLLNSGDKRLAEVIEEQEGRSSSSTTFSMMNFFSILYSGSP